MTDPDLDELAAMVSPLLRALDALGLVARHLNPTDIEGAIAAVGAQEGALRQARARLAAWPESLVRARPLLEASSDAALAAFDELRSASGHTHGLIGVFRALRHLPRAQEALYPLTRALVPVSRFFLNPDRRNDEDLLRRLWDAEPRDDTGILQTDNDSGARGGFSVYVPEYYSPARAWPLVVALHGGSGHGRGFLWSWLRDARSLGAILIAPTATGETWAISGSDTDTPNLARMLAFARERWNIDTTRLLLTGMSDGGTFSYVSGLESESPFTHLAPVAAAFNPMMTEFADSARMTNLPIHIVHGSLDWMFPADMARQAQRALSAAGARVTYVEIDDLRHTYPREANAAILRWLDETAASSG